MVFGLIAAVVLARGSVSRRSPWSCFGILLGLVGTDVNSGTIRFGFGQPELTDGIGFVALAMAFFGITDVVANLEHTDKADVYRERLGSVLPSLHDLRICFWSIAARHGAGLDPRHPAGRRRAARLVRRLYVREEDRKAAAHISARATSAASLRRNPPTTPARRPRLFRC